VQLLSYGTYEPLESALLRAASRGVRVSLLVSDWSLSRSRQRALKRLQEVDGITVRFTSIPEHSSGFIPFARVEHCKYLLADADRAWIGTSNWSPDYFEESRNAGFILRSGVLCRLLHRKYGRSWDGPYAVTIDPAIEYENRRRDDGGGK
jgi:phosphatidylserine/phosphatidylglycerophosphate/cardiolipin synthase-like enzyme